ncbi:phage major capsid protein [Facklamia sp. P13069]|uniref:phage major capsid protein n=1 Tax=Facklamia sp. P13069 TaxID=3421954 RepID=UPI003D16C76F
MNKFFNKEEVKNEFKDIMNAEDTTADQQVEAIMNYADTITEAATKQVKEEYEELRNVTDNNILMARGIHMLTGEETKFYNEVKKSGGDFNEQILPETVIERVFDDLEVDRPLLKLIKFKPGIGRTKIITAKRTGFAVWGKLHKDLEGQLDAIFGVSDRSLNALTAYFIISNDILDMGPRWMDRFLRICLKEAIAEQWEAKIIAGTGVGQPVGLMKDLGAARVDGSPYEDKKSAGTLTFKDAQTMVTEFTGVIKALSKYELKVGEETETRYRNINGKVKLIVNPENYADIVGRVTTQNANGVFVSNLPFISQDSIIVSTEMPVNKLIAYVDGQYEASASFNNRIYVYDETFAMRRARLYAIDLLGDGQPVDNYAAQVYDLAIDNGTTVVPGE